MGLLPKDSSWKIDPSTCDRLTQKTLFWLDRPVQSIWVFFCFCFSISSKTTRKTHFLASKKYEKMTIILLRAFRSKHYLRPSLTLLRPVDVSHTEVDGCRGFDSSSSYISWLSPALIPSCNMFPQASEKKMKKKKKKKRITHSTPLILFIFSWWYTVYIPYTIIC